MMPVGTAFTVALAVRLWVTVVELAWLALAQAMPSPTVAVVRSKLKSGR
jgi:hypothetical protein